MTQRDRTLAVLRAAGDTGVTNRVLNDTVGFRYGARLQELRDQGFQIETVRLKQGLYLYLLQSEPTVPSRRDPSGPLLGETTVRDGVRSVSRPEGTGGTRLFDLEPTEERHSAITGKPLEGREAA